jgi:cleavage and polyadenylation specificity factor subunit 1
MSRFPANTRFDNSWTTRKVALGEQVDAVAYSSASETYVLGTSRKSDFKLPDDDEVHIEWRNEGMFGCAF